MSEIQVDFGFSPLLRRVVFFKNVPVFGVLLEQIGAAVH
jgi:hypothetical protein